MAANRHDYASFDLERYFTQRASRISHLRSSFTFSRSRVVPCQIQSERLNQSLQRRLLSHFLHMLRKQAEIPLLIHLQNWPIAILLEQMPIPPFFLKNATIQTPDHHTTSSRPTYLSSPPPNTRTVLFDFTETL